MSGRRLTERQRQVAVLAAAGVPSKQIAARLGISPATVANHLYSVYGKTGARGREKLGAWLAARKG